MNLGQNGIDSMVINFIMPCDANFIKLWCHAVTLASIIV